jgi:hypothetical protein
MKRKIEIIFEEEEVIFLNTSRRFQSFCRRCGQMVEALNAEVVAAFLGSGLACLLKEENIHFVEADKDFICRRSLETCGKIGQISSRGK